MFSLPELPYSYDALEPYIDKETMHLHHDKHHATYVTNLNDFLKDQDHYLNMDVYQLMGQLNKLPETIRAKVRNNGGGHANHTFFWNIMAPKVGGEPTGKLMDAINSSFGDFTKFTDAFTKAGLGRFGSGWVWVINKGNALSIIDTPNQDNPWMEGHVPILGIDVWEHAYYLKYQNRRADYIKAWWSVVNWKKVEENFNSAK